MKGPFLTIDWRNDAVVMIDQTTLPETVVYRRYTTDLGVAEAIRRMVVRGAPAIGVAAALGCALGAQRIRTDDPGVYLARFEKVCDRLAATRPTAVNLFWAVERMRRTARSLAGTTVAEIRRRLLAEALSVLKEDRAQSRALSCHGAGLIGHGEAILTHCNAGALATAGYGTALGVIRAAAGQGKRPRVFVDETRPRLQGARLTAWELTRYGIEATLIVDGAAASLMQAGRIDRVVVGADRIAVNGDVCNKIGTLPVAVNARHFGIPFHAVAPYSTIDPALPDGSLIPIEQRDPSEVMADDFRAAHLPGLAVENPAFDVTPAGLVTSIVTERGVHRPPYRFGQVVGGHYRVDGPDDRA